MLAGLLLGSLVPATAFGHGRFPELGRLAFHPTDDDVFLARGTFGMVATDDGGASFHWICPTVIGARWTEDPAITIASDGAFIVGVFDGLARGIDGGCNWSFPSTDLLDEVVIDVDRTRDASTLFALASSGGRDNGLWASTDSGATWVATNPAIEPVLFETVRVAPSDPDRIYLTGAYPPSVDMPRRPFVYASDDGGMTFTVVAFTDFREGDRNVYLLGVDPTDAERMLIRVRADDSDRVYESTDGGATFTEIFSLASVDGFAWSDDGAKVWLGSKVSPSLQMSTDGGRVFTELRSDLSVSCLGARGDELFVCADNFANGFAIGRSTDDGVTIDPLFVLADIDGLGSCDASSDTATTCTEELADLALDLGLPWDAGVADGGIDGSLPDGAMPDADAGLDGGVDSSVEPGDGGGCECRSAAGPHRGRGLSIALLAVAFVAMRPTRRRVDTRRRGR
jgi:hypothetical protein